MAAVGPGEQVKIELMAPCLDFRRMAFDPAFDIAKAEEAVCKLRSWFNLRNVGFVDIQAGVSGQASGSHSPLPNDLPSDDSLTVKLRLVHSRLQEAATELPFKRSWKDARGTVIAEDVFTKDRFRQSVDEYLYLFQHCATKSV